jgi:hypothetical protein
MMSMLLSADDEQLLSADYRQLLSDKDEKHAIC